jgi:hypothetical protein
MVVDNKARDILIKLVVEESEHMPFDEVERIVDKVLTTLWVKGYAIVPHETTNTEPEPDIDAY